MRHHVCLMAALAAMYACAGSAQPRTTPLAEDAAAAGAPPPAATSVGLRYLGVLGAYTYGDSGRGSVDDAYGFSLIYGAPLRGRLGYEVHLFGDVFETGVDGFTDYYRPGLGLDLTWAFADRARLTPFLLAGAGGVYNDVAPDRFDEFGWFANLGAGLVTRPLGRDGIAARGEIRALYDDYLDGYLDYRIGLGIELPLMSESQTPGAVRERVRVVEVATGLTDGDGDGVIDGADQCPDTPPNTRVDGQGCTLPDTLPLRGVTFEFNEDRLTANAKVVLDELALPILNRYPDMIVEVAGHTDNVGGDRYNQQLSERRAAAVRDYFAAHGIKPERMSAVGYGKREPIATNETEVGRELNRRVELRIKN